MRWDYSEIPGTTVFDGEQSRRGYHLNQFCMSLLNPANRNRFKADEEAYLSEWNLTEAQKSAVLRRDYNAMIAEGGNIYFLGNIGATDGKSFVELTATMTGMTPESYTAMMVRGGRAPGAPLTVPQPINPAEGGPAEGGPAEGGPAEGGPAEGGPAEGGPAEGGPAEGGL
jgi:protocatechuate 4,5-dioxygenase alpha chain